MPKTTPKTSTTAKPAFGSPEWHKLHPRKKGGTKRGSTVKKLRAEVKELRRESATTNKLLTKMAVKAGVVKKPTRAVATKKPTKRK